jgi:hypothetical protein
MKVGLHSFCLCLLFATVSCADPLSPGRPGSVDEPGAAGVRLEEGVTGRVTNDDGSAIAGATVLAASVDPNGPAVPEIAIVSDADGRYEWPLRAGRYELTVLAEGYERGSRVVEVKAREVARLDFRLARRR